MSLLVNGKSSVDGAEVPLQVDSSGAIVLSPSTGATAAGGHGKTVTITRPANVTPYTALDVIGDTNGSAIFEFTNMAKTGGGEVMVTSVSIEYDVTAVPAGMTSFVLRFYNASPTAIADNAGWDFPVADRGKYLGKFTSSAMVDETNTCFVEDHQINQQMTLTSTSLFLQLQTTDGWTAHANSTVFRVTIHTVDV